jgi:hypothetical protein
MERNYSTCPICEADIETRRMRLSQPFLCAHCGTELTAPPIYSATVMLSSLVLPATVGYASGLSGLSLLLTALIAIFPTSMLLMKIARTCARPRFYPTQNLEQ